MARLLSSVLFVLFCASATAGLDAGGVDRTVSGRSAYPIASDPSKVGRYPGPAMSGAGYFYDYVLEYRVWLHPHDGSIKKNGNDVYFRAFAQYERAVEFSKQSKGAEEPLVLVRQLKYINEPKPGQFEVIDEERITEWQVQWLSGSKRQPGSVAKFISDHTK